KVTISATAQITGYPSLTATVVVTTSVPTPPPPPTPGPTWGIATQPQLPQATVNTSVPAPTGKQLMVNTGDDLQAALNAAQPGDEVLLAPGATFVGNFVLPGKTGTGWVTV